MFIVVRERSYGFWKFIGDCLMVFFTFGFWIIWILVRELRRRPTYYIQ